MNITNDLYKKMISFYSGDPEHIQHFIKVHSIARLIGEEEGLDEKTQFILETAALVHDIGIKPSMEKYGSSAGKYQEKEGPAYAKKMLEELDYEPEVVERVCYLVGHHHTYTDIDGLDYQILVEADFLVNYFENGNSTENIKLSVEKIFHTGSGKAIAKEMFFPESAAFEMSETWAQDALQDLEDFIEEQGIYIRQ